MGQQTRWDKVKKLIEDALTDENVRNLYQYGSEEAIQADLEARGIYPDDYNLIKNHDLPLLIPDTEIPIFWIFKYEGDEAA